MALAIGDLVSKAKKAKNVVDGLSAFFLWKNDSNRTLALELEQWAAERPHDPFLWFEDRTWTIGEVNDQVNRRANAYRGLGLRAGDAVALMMDNRPAFIFHLYGLAKIGVEAALINPHLTGHLLEHAVRIASPKVLVASSRCLEQVSGSEDTWDKLLPLGVYIDTEPGLTRPEGRPAFVDLLAGASSGNPKETVDRKLGDVMAYIYTSGTTGGLPKAAPLKHHRFWRIGHVMSGGLLATPDDCVYCCLPLYHSNATLIALSFAIATRCRLALARKFSASRFWEDCVKSGATVFMYIGEVCRYLNNTPPGPWDRAHSITRIVGNGLRPDIWEGFVSRFGIKRVIEFYGSTEGNAESINLLGTPGSCGVMIPGKMAIVKYDIDEEEFIRDAKGFCVPTEPGEPGVLLGHIKPRNEFAGYTDEGATSAKIETDVFKPGDRWFNTGDLLKHDKLRRMYFVDRLGDTFRWKGENVSTNEVQEVLNHAPGVKESTVYGVKIPGTDGRAGMAAVVVAAGGELDGDAVFRQVDAKLPKYAQPRFLRVVDSLEVTGTFKHKKTGLKKEGFDPAEIKDPLWLRDGKGGTYVPLTVELYRDVVEGRWAV